MLADLHPAGKCPTQPMIDGSCDWSRVTGYTEVMPAEPPDTAYAKISFTFSRTC